MWTPFGRAILLSNAFTFRFFTFGHFSVTGSNTACARARGTVARPVLRGLQLDERTEFRESERRSAGSARSSSRRRWPAADSRGSFKSARGSGFDRS
jgi:hypothetical protein